MPKYSTILLLAGAVLLVPDRASGQDLSLPEGAETSWIVEGPEEILAYYTFDPATVAERLPEGLTFVTVADIAAAGNEQARAHVAANPTRTHWGVSFLEIVRQDVFEIDGRRPDIPDDGAFALWFASVWSEDGKSAPPEKLALDLWMPDAAYASYMRQKGHFARPGDVRLSRTEDGAWVGYVEVDDLRVEARCTPEEAVRAKGPGRGVVHPPAGSDVRNVVRTSFVGHEEQVCEEDDWDVTGTHPLSGSVRIATVQPTFLFGYSLRGGAYAE